jgi:hypothetical protein
LTRQCAGRKGEEDGEEEGGEEEEEESRRATPVSSKAKAAKWRGSRPSASARVGSAPRERRREIISWRRKRQA